MRETLLLGRGREMIEFPRKQWERTLLKASKFLEDWNKYMTEEHHLVHQFIVRELPRISEPIRPEFIAQELRLPLTQVVTILNEIQKHHISLFLDEKGRVEWACPFTVSDSPHHLTFSTGEKVNAA